MSKSRIKVMISSRNGSKIEFESRTQTFTDVRNALKQRIQDEKLFGESLFRVVINETEPPGDASEDVWEWSLREVREADIVIILYNGDSGWPGTGGVGICCSG